MRTQFAAVLLALAAPLHAIKVTSPSKNDVVDPSKGVTVKWSTVNTDPTRANLVLVNMASGHAPFKKDFGMVDLSSGSFVVTQDDVPADEGYQFNFESTATQNTGILAQSEQFEVQHSGDDASSSTTTGTAKTTAHTTAKTSVTTVTSSGTTATETDSTMTTVSSASKTATESETGSQTGSETGSATSSASTGAAAPTGMAMQGGSLLALIAGVAAVLA
ncbi:Ser-Thr-rich glycosyl-phosphatidyl-inositol-anchored membrane family-domain-containing protein [Chaetomidium leptoderma]|uniref:Ser-Thr-rich glycosyl-phosphatidyl-inositol-anchored membrane family-domain-containing protein n=1 Tax=Chaetomidium leptoderma TaxID=669021 RepID=A0AAN6ZUG1_9PEZI|nr:Ser-Thr-rich glycosyl-phosphatidyl-inositol-anchored membrane family-domain-containing protein [Chaetomidium leptoderma]